MITARPLLVTPRPAVEHAATLTPRPSRRQAVPLDLDDSPSPASTAQTCSGLLSRPMHASRLDTKKNTLDWQRGAVSPFSSPSTGTPSEVGHLVIPSHPERTNSAPTVLSGRKTLSSHNHSIGERSMSLDSDADSLPRFLPPPTEIVQKDLTSLDQDGDDLDEMMKSNDTASSGSQDVMSCGKSNAIDRISKSGKNRRERTESAGGGQTTTQRTSYENRTALGANRTFPFGSTTNRYLPSSVIQKTDTLRSRSADTWSFNKASPQIFVCPYGLPLKAFVLSPQSQMRQNLERIIYSHGGLISSHEEATLIVVHFPEMIDFWTLDENTLPIILRNLQDPGRLVVDGRWIDHCIDLCLQDSHTFFTPRLDGNKLFPPKHLSPAIDDIRPSSTLLNPKSSHASSSGDFDGARENDASALILDQGDKDNGQDLWDNKRPFSSEKKATESISIQKSDGEQQVRSSSRRKRVSSSNERAKSRLLPQVTDLAGRPTTRSALSSILEMNAKTEVYLGLKPGPFGSGGPKIFSYGTAPDPKDEIAYSILADSLKIWLDERQNAVYPMCRTAFLASLDEHSPSERRYERYYTKYRHLLMRDVPGLSDVDKRKLPWQIEEVYSGKTLSE